MEFITPTEVWQLAALQLLFYLFIAWGVVFYLVWRRPIVFVILISVFSALAYLIMIWQAILPWWGLSGDEIFVHAFLEKVAAGQFWSDFFYSGLVPFYPPLYFWLVGGIAAIFNLNGITAGQLGVFLVLLLTPISIYFWQKSRGQENRWLLALVPSMIYVVADWSAIILKPYEFISAVLVVLWTIFLFEDIYYHRLNKISLSFYGIIGGLLFLIFYFWFFIVLIAAAIFKLIIDTDIKYYFRNLGLVWLMIFLVSLPFTLPLVITYWQLGTENWQLAWFIPEYLEIYLPFLSFSVFGLVSIMALITLVWLREKIIIRALGSLLVACYLWQAINLLTIYFWDAPFLPAKPFLFLGGAVLSIIAAYGLSEFLAEKIKNQKLQFIFVVAGISLLASQLPFGYFFTDHIDYNLSVMKYPLREEYVNLIDNLRNVDDLEQLTILSSGTPEISAFLPLDYYVSYNVHFSHPAANFSQRYNFVRTLAVSPEAGSFYQMLKQSPLARIDALLLLKGDGFYPINFWVDDYPLGGKAVEIKIPANLISEQYFVKVFEDRQFVFYRVK